MLRLVHHIDEDSDQVIAIRLTLAAPEAADDLGLGRYSPEFLLQFEQRVRYKAVGDWLSVIEPEREHDLVAPE